MKKLNLKWKKISNKLYSLLKHLEGAEDFGSFFFKKVLTDENELI